MCNRPPCQLPPVPSSPHATASCTDLLPAVCAALPPELPAVLQPTQLPLTSSMNTAGLSRLEPAASCAPGTPTGGEADGGEELLLAWPHEVAMTQA